MKVKFPTNASLARTIIWSLLLAFIPVGLATSPSASAATVLALSDSDALVFNRANGYTNFVGDGKSAGNQVLYKSVGNFGGISIDCLITTVSVDGAITTYDAEGSATTLPAATYKNNFMINTTGGEARMRFEFFKAGTYTGTGTGISVVLQNVKVTSIDLDSSGTNAYQYSDFTGFQKYSMMSPTNLAVQPITGSGASDPNRTRFIATKAGARSSAPEDQVLVKYDAMSSMEVRFGNVVAGSGNYFGLVFGGWPGTGTPVEYSNSFNAPPVSTDTSMYVADTTTVSALTIIPTSAFGAYSDPDGNPFYAVKISTVSSGKLQLNNGTGTWSDVTANQVITISDIDAGYLRYAPSSMGVTETVKFYVNDGLDYSIATNTLTLSRVTDSQVITFANPGAKAPSTTFASSATSSSGLTVVLTSNTPGVCTISGLNIVTVGNGTCSVTATQPGNGTYGSAAPVTREFPVTSKTPQVITFANPGTKSESTTAFNSGATTNATGLFVTLTSANTSICTVTNSASAQPKITPLKAGFCTVVATQDGNATYDPAVQVSQTFEITSASSASVSTSSPFVFTTGAETVTTTSAYLTGLLTANGASLKYKFCWSYNSQTNSTTGALNYTRSGNNRVKCSSSETTLASTETHVKVSENINSYISKDNPNATLQKDTTYYFQVVGITSSATIYGKVFQFRTKNDGSNSYLLAKTNPATGITTSQATLNGIVEAKEVTTTLSFCVSTKYEISSMQYLSSCDVVPFSTIVNNSVAAGSLGSETSTASVVNGLSGSTYYFYQIKAYSSRSKITTYGNIVVFKTAAPAQVVNTLPVTTFESTTAVLPGTVLANGESTTVSFQFCTTASSTTCSDSGMTASPSSVSGTTSKSISYSASGLTIGQRYFYRAKGTRGAVDVFGEVKSFVVGAPTVVTLAPTSLSSSTPWNATLNGYFKPNGSNALLYFCLESTTSVNTTGLMTACDTGGTTSLVAANIDSSTTSLMDSLTATGLIPSTTYYYQAVAMNATNNALVSYGTIQSFTTASVPTASTSEATSVTATGATLNGVVGSHGAQTKVVFCFSSSNDRSPDYIDQLLSCDQVPVPSSSPLISTADSATVTFDISSLTKSTTYYYQVYAENSMGSAIGEVKSFTTNAGGPAATTRPATLLNKSAKTVTLNGSINANGSLTTGYFCWGADSTTATVAGGESLTACTTAPAGGFVILASDSSTVSESQGITVPSNASPYYFQIYGVNARGEYSYGAVLSFNLSNPIAVTYETVTAITASSAAIRGSVNAQGVSNVGGRFCIGLSPTLDANGVLADCAQNIDDVIQVSISGSSAVEMPVSLSGLDSGQTYYYQAYSVDRNSADTPKPPTSLGAVYSFNTLAVVTFNPNGGTGSVDSQTAGSTTALKSVSDIGFTNGSLAFDGWNTETDGSGVSYADRYAYGFQDSMDLYAQWVELTTYSVTYANGGGEGTLPTETPKAGGSHFNSASGSGLSKSGYSFAGWSCNGVTYSAGASITMTSGALVCTAIWNAVSSGGSGGGGGGYTPAPTASPTPSATPSPSATPTAPTKVSPSPSASPKPTPTAPVAKPVIKATVTTKVTAKQIVANSIVTLTQVIKMEVPTNLEVTSISVNGANSGSTITAPRPTASPAAGKEPAATQSVSAVSTKVIGPDDNVKVNATSGTGEKIQGVVDIQKVDPFTLANVNFDFGSAKLTPAAKKILDQVAAVVIDHGFNLIQLTGHTDVFASAGYSNQVLSDQRAAAVRAYLAKKLAGEGVVVQTLGLAAKEPVIAKTDAASRALNRRVEIGVASK